MCAELNINYLLAAASLSKSPPLMSRNSGPWGRHSPDTLLTCRQFTSWAKAQLLDRFQVHGPNGIHDVLVTRCTRPHIFFLHAGPQRTSYQSMAGLSCHIISWRFFTHWHSRSFALNQALHADIIMFFSTGLAELTVPVWTHTFNSIPN